MLREEMRRVVAFFEWQRDWWLRLAVNSVWDDRTTGNAIAQGNDYTEGRVAYAKRQAGIRTMMSEQCTKAWKDTELYLTLGEQL